MPYISYSNIQDALQGGSGWDTSLGTDGGGNVDADPLFVAPLDPDGPDDIFATADDGLLLQQTSPARNAGTNTNAPLFDILYVIRPLESITDMGAYEVAATP